MWPVKITYTPPALPPVAADGSITFESNAQKIFWLTTWTTLVFLTWFLIRIRLTSTPSPRQWNAYCKYIAWISFLALVDTIGVGAYSMLYRTNSAPHWFLAVFICLFYFVFYYKWLFVDGRYAPPSQARASSGFVSGRSGGGRGNRRSNRGRNSLFDNGDDSGGDSGAETQRPKRRQSLPRRQYVQPQNSRAGQNQNPAPQMSQDKPAPQPTPQQTNQGAQTGNTQSAPQPAPPPNPQVLYKWDPDAALFVEVGS
ncbi:hypothetical protein F5Y05DRAFT_371561 [Hypoxylon sp. FL0543]|nr:hypothetical protein F5Y05DRAFT_371561 [Hypoxylon sp. FL0543]